MIQSLKLLGRPAFRRIVLFSSEATASKEPIATKDPWEGFITDLQKDLKLKIKTEIVRPENLSLIEDVKKNGVLSTPNFIGFLKNCVDKGLDATEKGLIDQISPEKQVETLDYDSCIESVSRLLKLGLQDEPIFSALIKKLEGITMEELNPSTVIFCINMAKKANYKIPDSIMAPFIRSLENQYSSLKIAEVLSAFASIDLSKLPTLKGKLLNHTKNFINIMSSSEAVSLFRYLSAQGLREANLFKPAVQIIASNKASLSLNHIVDLAHASAKLKLHDNRLLRKISEDLLVEIIHMRSWFEAVSLIESFSRIGLEHPELWKVLSQWVMTRFEELKKQPFPVIRSIVKSFSMMNIEESKQVADVLAEKLLLPEARALVTTPKAWLDAIYSLALYDNLPLQIGETVLTKSFIDECFQNIKQDSRKVDIACKLLQIQSSLLLKYGESYKGARISKETFGKLLTSEDAIPSILHSKYGNSFQNNIDSLLACGFYQLAPKSYIEAGRIDENGFYWNAAISVNENQRFVPTSTWTKNTIVRPVILIDWKQRKKTLDLLSKRPTEKLLRGEEQMMLRHLRARGLDPIVVFMSDLTSMANQDAKNKFLKELARVK